MTMLQKAINRLRDIRSAFLSESVVYDRLGVQVTLNATRGSTSYEVFDDSGMAVRSRSTDFLITAADLVLNSIVELPERGDKIRVTVDAVVYVYEVLNLGDSHYRLSDPYGTTLRVFTKLVSTT